MMNDGKHLELMRRVKDDVNIFTKLLYKWKFLAPKQKELLAMDASINVILAGRRFGKSSLMAAKAFHWCLQNPHKVSLIIAPSLEQAKIYFELLVGALEKHPFSVFVKSIKQNPFPEMVLLNGAKLLFRSTAFKGRYLRGRKVHMVTITEASFVDEGVFENVIMPMRLDTRAKLYLESTPFGRNYFYKFYQEGMKGSDLIKCFHATVYDNVALSPEEIERIKKVTNEFAWRSEYLAEFVDDENTVFTYELLTSVTEDYTPSGFRKGHKYVIGLDIAQKEDFTVLLVLDITHKPYVIADFRRFNQRSFDDIIMLANELSDIYNAAPVYVDATTLGRPIAEKIIRSKSITFTSKIKNDLIDNLILAFEQKKLRIPASNTILRDELRFFRRDLSSHYHKVSKYANPGNHDDTVIALALALWGAEEVVTGSFFVDIF